jgi:chromate reductase
MHNVIVLVGSLRRESWNRKLANTLAPLAPATLRMAQAEIGDLPLYNEDLEAKVPAEWQRFRTLIADADAVLFVTPEYNRSVPGVLKNALDVASRPLPQNAWRDKPSAIISVSQGAMGAFGANHHLRQVLVGVGARALVRPEVYIGNVAGILSSQGKITAPSTQQFLSDFLASFDEMIGLIKKS